MTTQFGPWIGMAQKPHPSHVRTDYLQYAQDVDFSRNTLAPMRSDRVILSTTDGSVVGNMNTLYYSNCCIKVYSECLDIAIDEQNCERVFASGLSGVDYPVTATPDEWCRTEYSRMGWPCNFTAPSAAYDAATQTPDLAEPRSFIYTYVNKYGEESPPSAPSPIVTIDYQIPVTLAGFTPCPAEYGAVSLKIYALVAGLSGAVGGGADGDDEFLEVATLPASTLLFRYDPAVYALGDALTTDEFIPVPSDAQDFQHWGQAQLAFRSEGSVRFTEPYNYSVAPIKYMYTPKAQLLRIAATQQYIYLLTCGQPEVLESKQACDMSGARQSNVLNDSFPLIGKLSVATYESSVIFASVQGLVQITAGSAMVITESIFTQHQWDTLQPHTMRGVVYQGYYYGATDVATFRIEMSRGPKSGYAEKFSYLSIRPTSFRVTEDDRLLYADATGVHELGQGPGFKTYTAITKDIYENGQSIHNSFRVHQEPGIVEVTQTVVDALGGGFPKVQRSTRTGAYRFPRRRGDAVRYTVKSNVEVSSLVVANSITSLTGKS